MHSHQCWFRSCLQCSQVGKHNRTAAHFLVEVTDGRLNWQLGRDALSRLSDWIRTNCHNSPLDKCIGSAINMERVRLLSAFEYQYADDQMSTCPSMCWVHWPPLRQPWLRQSSCIISQWSPRKPGAQTQRYGWPLGLLAFSHFPLFLQTPLLFWQNWRSAKLDKNVI